MSYRPITDLWILARPKVKYYGAYPNGFLERAKPLLGVAAGDPVLHVCGGHAKAYPNKRVMGEYDFTLDLDPSTQPDFLRDARADLPLYRCSDATCLGCTEGDYETGQQGHQWRGVLIDRPYTAADAAQYQPGAAAWPELNDLLARALGAVAHGRKVGVLDYLLPRPPGWAKFIACVGVVVGYNNRMRCFSVFERTV